MIVLVTLGFLQIQSKESFLSVPFSGTGKSVLLNVPVPAAGVQPVSVSLVGVPNRKSPAFAGPWVRRLVGWQVRGSCRFRDSKPKPR